jgi:hypothetical protein
MMLRVLAIAGSELSRERGRDNLDIIQISPWAGVESIAKTNIPKSHVFFIPFSLEAHSNWIV